MPGFGQAQIWSWPQYKIKYFAQTRILLSRLVTGSEELVGSLGGGKTTREDLLRIYEESGSDPRRLLDAAWLIGRRKKGHTVTFSKKAFFNVINMCRDICSYCTYRAEPESAKASMMPVSQVKKLLQTARRHNCVEALFVTGESPEEGYPQVREWLRQQGFSSMIEYLDHCSQLALDEGLFPHTNAGNLNADQLDVLKRTNVSLGLMLESSSDRLSMEGMPHHMAPSKNPKARIKVLENAGKRRIPMTTGILIGIGETPGEMIDSILTIRDLHKRYGNIQEVIVQNFQPESGTMMQSSPGADPGYFARVIALTRVAMPEMNVQAPPNLSPRSCRDLLSAGINDWGGISPITPDFVNPEFPWPQLDRVEEISSDAGLKLQCRFPVYPEFMDMIPPDLAGRIASLQDEHGLVREDRWR